VEKERLVKREAKTSDGKSQGLKPTYIPRLMLVGMIIILLAILIPVLRNDTGSPGRLAAVEAPIAMKHYSTGFASSDSLLNEALRCFDRKEYDEAARLLTKVHFYWSVQVREGKMKAFPEDLRFYLGLSEFYRGRPERAAPYLEEEERANPYEERYPWYLAHVYIALGDYGRAREALASVVKIGGAHAAEAQRKMRLLPTPADSPEGTEPLRSR
jgi:tetratricopeptide (TPR) repeat protein